MEKNRRMERINDNLRLSPIEKKHVQFMSEIAKSISDSPTALKGGTALLLAYGLDRYSEDLDFDSTKQLNLQKRINDSAKKLNIDVKAIHLKKDTPTTKRYVVQYNSEYGFSSLKIETSFRSKKINTQDTTTINGIKTYKIGTLINQKLDAAQNRTKVRDLFDINFISDKYGSSFSDKQIEQLGQLARDPDLLLSRYKGDHSADNILKKYSLDDIALKLLLTSDLLHEKYENQKAAKDFKEMSHEEAVKKHPKLAPYVSAVVAIEKRLDADKLTDKEKNIVMQQVQQNAVNNIKQGIITDSKLKTQLVNENNKDLSR